MYKIKKFVNAYRSSNTYILSNDTDNAIMIDAGGPDVDVVNTWLENNNKQLVAILLTHEHADHCLGLPQFYHQHKCDIYCTPECAKNIGISKQNMSFYIDEITTFEIDLPVKYVEDNQSLSIGGFELKVLKTPGHSPGGCCFYTQDLIFTGDTILNGIKSPVTFPHSSRKAYKASIDKILDVLQPKMLIWPGHGEAFSYVDKAQLVF
ncbi:MBL fold metallo-hydrolase [Lewinella sp. LCG006]|uniref:MBL fold metallo-hydrolase n=1 Tax=Lewinella sp. LCG006 TaxID=3231911 RepID=UPI003460465C